MAGAAGCVSPDPQPAVEPVVLADAPGAAGSLVLRRMDRRDHKRGTGAPLGRGFSLAPYGSPSTAFLDIQYY